MKLQSDFIDYYDHHFNGHGQVFNRFSKSGLTRSEMFDFLQKNGFKTPAFGQALKLHHPLYPYRKVVVYEDEMAHQGKGKRLLSSLEAIKYFPKHFASVYIPSAQPISYRHLQVGRYQFRLVYHSLSDLWRSNVGDVEIQIIEHSVGYHPTIREPLFAIDYVKEDETYYAIDYNIAPQIKGTGIEEILTPQDVVSTLIEPLNKANGW